MRRRMIVVIVLIVALLPLLMCATLWTVSAQGQQGYSMTVRVWDVSRYDLIVSRCTPWQPGRLMLMRTDLRRNNRLTDSLTTVLFGSRIAERCP